MLPRGRTVGFKGNSNYTGVVGSGEKIANCRDFTVHLVEKITRIVFLGKVVV